MSGSEGKMRWREESNLFKFAVLPQGLGLHQQGSMGEGKVRRWFTEMQHTWLARLETLCRAEGLLCVSWHRRPPFSLTLPVISQFCTGSELDIITEGPWGDSFFSLGLGYLCRCPDTGAVPHNPRSTKSSALRAAEKAPERLKLNDEGPMSCCTAGECRSEERPFGELSGHGNSITYVMTRGAQIFTWELGKDLFLFPPGWLPSLAKDSGSSQSDCAPSSSRAARLQPVAGETQHKLNQPIFKVILLLWIT